MIRRLLTMFLVCALPTATVLAQTLPMPAEFYFDEDRSALRDITPVKGDDEAAVVARLLRATERNPNAHAERAQLAGIAMRRGQTDEGRRLYQQAMQGLGEGNGLYRAVRWQAAWDHFRAGDAAEALTLWALLGQSGIKARWMPPTYALALWTLDRKDEAVKWYAAAVRTEPTLWSDAGRIDAQLPGWREVDRATLKAVHQAWQQTQP